MHFGLCASLIRALALLASSFKELASRGRGACGCWARIRRRHRLRCHQGRACPRSQRTQVNRGCRRVRDGGGCSGGLLTFRTSLNRRRRAFRREAAFCRAFPRTYLRSLFTSGSINVATADKNASISAVDNNAMKRTRGNRRVSQVYRWGAASAVGE